MAGAGSKFMTSRNEKSVVYDVGGQVPGMAHMRHPKRIAARCRRNRQALKARVREEARSHW